MRVARSRMWLFSGLGYALSLALACEGTKALEPGDPDAGLGDGGGPDAGLVDGGGPDAGTPDALRPALRVLFVGNSYTSVNDVPGILRDIAATAQAGPPIVTDQIVNGGAGLADHLRNPVVRDRIREKTWTHVVLQGQSQEFAAQPSATQLAQLVVDAGAKPTWFATWARAEGDDNLYPFSYSGPTEMQDFATFSYAEAMRAVPGSVLACVGEAFRASLAAHPEIRLHQPDGSHASLAGSYLAAATIYVALTGAPVPPLAAVPAGIGSKEALALRDAAAIGSGCAGVRPRAALRWQEGALGISKYDFGVAGTAIPAVLSFTNVGGMATEISGGVTVGAPFAWSGGTFPGGTSNPGTRPFCGGQLPPGASCRLSISFSGQSSGTGKMTFALGNGYSPSVSIPLQGTSGSTGRALLTVSEDVGFSGCSDARCGPRRFFNQNSINLVVTNRGGAATTILTPGTLATPFTWGAGGPFPGGSGDGMPTANQSSGAGYRDPDTTLPYCTGVLTPGAACLITVAIPAPMPGTSYSTAVKVSYADAVGPAPSEASRKINAYFSARPDAGGP